MKGEESYDKRSWCRRCYSHAQPFWQLELWRRFFRSGSHVRYLGWLYQGNVGDDLLFVAIQRLIRLPLIPLDPSEWEQKQHKTTLGKLAQKVRRVLTGYHKKTNNIILGGGTAINSSWAASYPSFSRQNVYIFGSGFRDPAVWGKRSLKPFEETIAPLVRQAYVRDHFAQKGLRNLGIDSEVIGDPVLSLCTPRSRAGKNPLFAINLGCDKGRVQVNLRRWQDCVAKVAAKLLCKGWTLECLAFSKQDLPDLRAWCASMSLPPDRLIVHCYDSPLAMLKRIQKYSLVISQRLHVAVLAMGNGIPTICVNYRPKCLHFMESMNASDCCITDREPREDVVLGKVNDVLQNYAEYSSRLVKITEKYQSKQIKAGRKIEETLWTSYRS